MLLLPWMLTHRQPFEVPAPFNYSLFRRHDSNQTEGPQLSQRQLRYAGGNVSDARFPGKCPNDFSPANDTTPWLSFDAMPVNQCEANTGIVCRNPGPTCGFARKNRPTVGEVDNSRRKSAKAVPFFIAIHREIKPVGVWEK